MTDGSAALLRQRTHVVVEGARIAVYVARPRIAPVTPEALEAPVTPMATVVMLGAIWSVTPHIEDLCDQLAERGHAAVAPCLFRGVGIPARDAPPDVLRQAFLDFDDLRCVRDLRAVVGATARGELGFAPGPVVTLGFCLGGRFAHYLGAVSEHTAAVVNFYGRLRFARQSGKPVLPIELTGLIEVPYLGHFAETDDMIPLADVEELRTALALRGVPHRIEIYAGARHGFVDPGRPTEHHAAAAARAWATTLRFLEGLHAR